jgi:hypothetical protein
MPRFSLSSDDVSPNETTPEVEASIWMSAIGGALKRLGLVGERSVQVECELAAEGAVQLSEADTGMRLTISSIPSGEGVPAAWTLDDDPTNELWDPPEPAGIPAFADRESQGEADFGRVCAQAAQILDCVSVEAAYELALDILMSSVPAESASILILDGVKLRFVAVRGPRAATLQGVEMPCDEGIAGVALSSQTALVVREPEKHRSHFDEVDRWAAYKTRALMAVPIRCDGPALGVLELLNPFGHVDFAKWHGKAAAEVSRLLAIRIAQGS